MAQPTTSVAAFGFTQIITRLGPRGGDKGCVPAPNARLERGEKSTQGTWFSIGYGRVKP
jgi:hypothetical protein